MYEFKTSIVNKTKLVSWDQKLDSLFAENHEDILKNDSKFEQDFFGRFKSLQVENRYISTGLYTTPHFTKIMLRSVDISL